MREAGLRVSDDLTRLQQQERHACFGCVPAQKAKKQKHEANKQQSKLPHFDQEAETESGEREPMSSATTSPLHAFPGFGT